MLFDTHTHISHPKFFGDLAQVLVRAAEAGVSLMMDVADSEETSYRVVETASRIQGCYAAVGVHPHHSGEWGDGTYERIRTLARHERVRAIGEIGLDYFYHFAPKETQFRVFRAQIQLAREAGLPLIIHDRDAHADILQVLSEEGANAIGGIVHCWSADWETAERVLALGFYLGFGGSTTYPKNTAIREVAQRVPLDRLVLETDCPYLAPVPFRGKRNEPAYVNEVAAFIAQLRGISLAELVQITQENGKRVLRVG